MNDATQNETAFEYVATLATAIDKLISVIKQIEVEGVTEAKAKHRALSGLNFMLQDARSLFADGTKAYATHVVMEWEWALEEIELLPFYDVDVLTANIGAIVALIAIELDV